MGCNCRVTESILGLIILVFALWTVAYSQWIIIVAAVVLIIHALTCKSCSVPREMAKPVRAVKKKRK